MSDAIERFVALVPSGLDQCTLRVSREHSELLSVRRGITQPPRCSDDDGAMVTVVAAGGQGYAATSDLSDSGLRAAIERARSWAERSAAFSAVDWKNVPRTQGSGTWRAPVARPWADVPLEEKLSLLHRADAALQAGDSIVEHAATLWHTRTATQLVTADGDIIDQRSELLVPDLAAVANAGTDTVSRSLASRGLCRQGGFELLGAYDDAGRHSGGLDLIGEARRIGAEAAALLAAPICPVGTMDLVLDPDQMLLQIHESIGHPLELDRILGDERNYAGTSFVRPEMFGTYRYGSELLNITFDPTIAGEFAAYGYDDDGTAATRVHLIADGILQRPLGSAVSGARSGLPHVANARSSGWNRPAIDRMANLNLEPGDLSEAELIAGVERGILMRTNCSWSIDDSRNKFQFGCEAGWLIVDGVLQGMVRNPGYRGISATFWRSLDGVGDAASWRIYGSPFCGKGEPNQVIRVGHGAPICRFRGVEVFGS
jgi:predicted Zn-dependent protease